MDGSIKNPGVYILAAQNVVSLDTVQQRAMTATSVSSSLPYSFLSRHKFELVFTDYNMISQDQEAFEEDLKQSV